MNFVEPKSQSKEKRYKIMKFHLMIIVFALSLMTLAGCTKEWGFSRTVEGCVVGAGQRYKAGAGGSGTDKIALTLSNAKADSVVMETAGGRGADGTPNVTVECHSTACASIQPGTRISLRCGKDTRFWGEDDVIFCKSPKQLGACGQ